MSKLGEKLIAEADALVSVAEKLSRDASAADSNLGPDRIEELGSVASRGGQLIRKLYGSDSQHLVNLTRVLSTRNFGQMHSEWHDHVSELCGIL